MPKDNLDKVGKYGMDREEMDNLVNEILAYGHNGGVENTSILIYMEGRYYIWNISQSRPLNVYYMGIQRAMEAWREYAQEMGLEITWVGKITRYGPSTMLNNSTQQSEEREALAVPEDELVECPLCEFSLLREALVIRVYNGEEYQACAYCINQLPE